MHSRIVVTNDSEFIGEGFEGTGTAEDPYVISNVMIESQADAITIQYTTAHFVIRDSWISSTTQGMILSHVQNGTIENCTIDSRSNGIFISESTDLTINSVEIRGAYRGINAERPSNSVIRDSKIHHNRDGIYIENGNSIDISTCSVYTNALSGITLQNGTTNNTVSSCDIGWNWHRDVGSMGQEHNAIDVGENNIWSSNRYSDYDGETSYEIGNGIVVNPIPLSDNLVPSVIGSEDIRLDEGDGVQIIHWNATDAFMSFYELWLDGEMISEGSWYSRQFSLNLAEIELGSHNYTAVFIDAAGNEGSDQIWVSVLVNVFGGEGTVLVLYGSLMSVGLVLLILIMMKRMR